MQQIIENRPFASVEDFIFNENITYSKLNKRALDVLCRSGALAELIDERFTGDRHFWSAVCVDRPRKKKNLDENIEKYAPEGEFSEEEKIEFLASLTGIFPMSLVLTTDVQRRLDELYVPPISEYDSELRLCWCIPREITVKKSRNGKDFFVVKVIDSNSVQKTIRCWSIDKAKDKIHINRPYMLKPKFSVEWGFSTYGRVNQAWVLLG